MSDDREAARFFKLAADQGIAPAQFNLGISYAKGQGGFPIHSYDGQRRRPSVGWRHGVALNPYLSGRPGYRSLRKARRINAAKETLQFASGTGCHPTTRRSPTAWAWDYQSAARSSKITEDGCGRLGIGQGMRYFSLRSRSADVIRRSIRFCAVWPTLAASYPGG